LGAADADPVAPGVGDAVSVRVGLKRLRLATTS